MYTGATRARQGEPADLSIRVCRPVTGTGDVEYRFATTQEAEFAVRDTGYRTRWRWSDGRAFATPGPTVVVERGKCVEWSTRWTGLDAAGRPLAPGGYEVVAHLTHESPQGMVRVTAAFQVE